MIQLHLNIKIWKKKTGYKWANENGYQYIYGIIDITGTDEYYEGEDTYNEGGIRTCTKRKLAKIIFGSERAYDFIIKAYKLGTKYIKSA